MPTTAPRTATYLTVTTIVRLYMLGALAISFNPSSAPARRSG